MELGQILFFLTFGFLFSQFTKEPGILPKQYAGFFYRLTLLRSRLRFRGVYWFYLPSSFPSSGASVGDGVGSGVGVGVGIGVGSGVGTVTFTPQVAECATPAASVISKTTVLTPSFSAVMVTV